MSLWKSLFGGSTTKTAAGSPTATPAAEHNGFAITAEPFDAGGKFQIAGTISKEIDGTVKQHRFIRADTFSTRDEAASFTVVKARQIIDQLGDRLFDR